MEECVNKFSCKWLQHDCRVSVLNEFSFSLFHQQFIFLPLGISVVHCLYVLVLHRCRCDCLNMTGCSYSLNENSCFRFAPSTSALYVHIPHVCVFFPVLHFSQTLNTLSNGRYSMMCTYWSLKICFFNMCWWKCLVCSVLSNEEDSRRKRMEMWLCMSAWIDGWKDLVNIIW